MNNDTITVKTLIDNDCFIDDNVESKFINAISAFIDIINFLKTNMTNKGNSGVTFLDDYYYMPSLYLDKNDINNLTMSDVNYNSSYILVNKNSSQDADYSDAKKVIEDYIIIRFKEIAENHLSDLESLQDVKYIKNLDENSFTVQLESKFNRTNLNRINNTIYKYM